MKGLATILASLVLALPTVAQERHANVRLDDGRVIQGVVTAISLESVDVHVGDKIFRIPASRVRSFQFLTEEPASGPQATEPPAATGESPAGEPSAAAPLGETTGGESAAQESAAGAEATQAEAAEPDPAVAAGDTPAVDAAREPAPQAAGPGPAAARGGAVPAASPEPEGPLWKRRLAALDARYPWLAPAMPSQWVSLGLLLLVGVGLSVHFSVRIAGAEAPELGRSVLLGIVYIVAGGLQAGLVPVEHFTVALMLLANTSVVLLLLGLLFGLQRFGAFVALMMQLGFSMLAYGILELVTALLGSVGVAA